MEMDWCVRRHVICVSVLVFDLFGVCIFSAPNQRGASQTFKNKCCFSFFRLNILRVVMVLTGYYRSEYVNCTFDFSIYFRHFQGFVFARCTPRRKCVEMRAVFRMW